MYHYTESGLNNVWLLDGFSFRETPYGRTVSIVNMPELHAAIANILIREKPRWSGAEFRFIRKELDMSQAGVAQIFGKDAQTIARWEKIGRVPKMADRFLRKLYREHVGGNETIIEIVNRLNDLDQKDHARMQFETSKSGWTKAA